jgi:hypothetical protein
MRNVSDKCYRENQNTHFTFKNIFPKTVSLQDNVEKFDGARQVVGNMAHARCMLDK